ncbi:hypothetical protein [Microbacterium testaceum]|uniref:HTH cro/C1-type domain-containing protein n=1 Tax=Microbacterium testaceum TaxID=2033 RepID=A0A147F4X7_MICTE|nr:hypothetical protein [Microbacterium testaceum]KTS09067.1 hypothetical protein RSA3_14315 [Microbacterium testaceum]
MDNYTQRLADALVSEIKAEMGRRDLSSRALGRLIGESSQYMSTRLDGGNPRTGERVTLNIRDVYAIASALDIDALELMGRAQRIANEASNVTPFRGRNVGPLADDELQAVARPADLEPTDEQPSYDEPS